jgi:hypothetical protein
MRGVFQIGLDVEVKHGLGRVPNETFMKWKQQIDCEMAIKCFVATTDRWDGDCGTDTNDRGEGAGRMMVWINVDK